MIKVDENGIISVTEVRAEAKIEVERDAKKHIKNDDYVDERNRENNPEFKVIMMQSDAYQVHNLNV